MFQGEPGFIRTARTPRAGAISLLKRRAWYADGEGEGDATDTDTTQDKGGGNTGATFTQEQLDKIVGERAKRAKEAAVADLLKELGIDSADTLKAKVKAQADAEAAQLSELEKVAKKAADLEAKLKEAETKATQAAQQALEKERNTAILLALKDAQAEKPQSVLNLLLVEHKADVSAVMAEDGTLDAKKIAQLADKAKAEYAGMFQSGNPGSQSHSGGKTPKPEHLEKEARERNFRIRRRTI